MTRTSTSNDQLKRTDYPFRLCSGETILTDRVNSPSDSIRKSSISSLVRGEAKAKLFSEKGVNAELFSDFDGNDEMEKVVGGYDSMQPPQHHCLERSLC